MSIATASRSGFGAPSRKPPPSSCRRFAMRSGAEIAAGEHDGRARDRRWASRAIPQTRAEPGGLDQPRSGLARPARRGPGAASVARPVGPCRARAFRARAGSAPRHRARAVRNGVSAGGRAFARAWSAPRPCCAGGIREAGMISPAKFIPDPRGRRSDRRDRPLDAERRLPGGAALAAARPQGPQGRGQSVGRAAARSERSS